jgi:hypothetical protein
MQNDKKSPISKEAEVAAVFEKFPWLEEHFERTKISNVRFVPITMEVMHNSVGERAAIVNDPTKCGGVVGMEKLGFMFTPDGTLLRQIGVRRAHNLSKRAAKLFEFMTGIVKRNETVAEAVDDIQKSGYTVHFIIGLILEKDDPRQRYTMIITMPPEGSSIGRCLQKEMGRARAAMCDKLAAAFGDKDPPKVS